MVGLLELRARGGSIIHSFKQIKDLLLRIKLMGRFRVKEHFKLLSKEGLIVWFL
jgi:hypothetical protein